MADPTTLPDQTDVLVIGGGIMGTSTAYFLARETDHSVTLVEKDSIGSGSTGDSSAIIRHHYGDQSIYTKMAWLSHALFYSDFETITGSPLSYESQPFVRFARSGTRGGKYVEAGYEILVDGDIPVTWVDGSELAERFPMFSDVDAYNFAVIDQKAAYSDGADAASGLARSAVTHGASVVTDVTVTGIETQGGSVHAVETDRGSISCTNVVIAAGPWSPRLLADVGVTVPITPTREQVIVLEPPDEFRREQLAELPTTGPPGGRWYLRPDFGERVLVATHYHDEQVDPDTYSQNPDEETILELVENISETVPALKEAGIAGKYCGIYSVTPDHDFILDSVGPDGCYVAAGFSGHGFKHGPAVGKIMSDLVTSGTTDLVDVDYFSLERFRQSPAGHGKPDDSI